MPELPDVVVYVERLEALIGGQVLEGVRVASPFVLRSVDPPISAVAGRRVAGVRRMGKRIVLALEDEHFIVIHLMIAGRLRRRPAASPIPRRNGLAAFDFAAGTILLTEASRKKRASLHLVRGKDALAVHDRGGLEVLDSTAEEFHRTLVRESHTLKRALTDPRLFSGIGNAYSDEILHAAKLSPTQLTRNLTVEEVTRLHRHTCAVLRSWIERTRRKVGEGFPEKVTAFRDGMAVHGRYREPCPDCGAPVQRIVYAENEVNYCAKCQTGGKLLADRAFSKLLKRDWPRTLDEWVDGLAERRAGSHRPDPGDHAAPD